MYYIYFYILYKILNNKFFLTIQSGNFSRDFLTYIFFSCTNNFERARCINMRAYIRENKH